MHDPASSEGPAGGVTPGAPGPHTPLAASSDDIVVAVPAASLGKEPASEAAEEKAEMVPLKELLTRFATPLDKFFMIVGSLGAIANGAVLPLFALLIADLSEELYTAPDVADAVSKVALNFFFVAILNWVGGYLEMSFWMLSAERQTNRIREEYIRAMLRQEMAFYDTTKPGELVTRLSADVDQVREALGEKVATVLHHMATLIVGLVLGLVRGWQLALVILALSPFIAWTFGKLAVAMKEMESSQLDAYGRAGMIVDEVLTSIRTVTAFGGERRETERYSKELQTVCTEAEKKAVASGIAIGSATGAIFCMYGISLYVGAHLIAGSVLNQFTDKPYTGTDVLAVFFSVLMGAMAIGQAGPMVPPIMSGLTAAHRLFALIDRESQIDPLKLLRGQKPIPRSQFKGHLRLEKVHFAYPTRRDYQLFTDLDLEILPGQTVALVGHSGNGKSTIVSLIERFYDPDAGQLTCDGVPLSELDLRWWRSQIGLVSQEPLLFSSSIMENIRYGKPSASDAEVREAARTANAEEFIVKLTDGYATFCGEGGSQLSGGQKQRIAIARALLKNPRILLLDEATSALDSESEKVVQIALEQLMEQRTTLIIAHRLSTVRHADRICFIGDGRVLESGSHDELMAAGGVYAALVEAQAHGGDTKQASAAASAAAEPETDDQKEGSDDVVALAREISAAIVEKEKSHPSAATSIGTHRVASIGSGAGAPGGEGDMDEDNDVETDTDKALIAQDDAAAPEVSWRRIWEFVRLDRGWFFLGLFCAAADGVALPIWSIAFARFVTAFYDPDFEALKTEALKMGFVLVGMGIGMFMAEATWFATFGKVGARLAKRLRERSFIAVLRENMGWHDNPVHNGKIIATRLATDATKVHGAFVSRVGSFVQLTALSIAGLTIAFVASWQVTLVVLAIGPLMAVSSMFQMQFMTGFSETSKTQFEAANQVASEAILSLRTVASYTQEEQTVTKFGELLGNLVRTNMKRAHVTGIGFGFAGFVMFAAYALVFWLGGQWVEDGSVGRQGILEAFFAVMMLAMGAGQSFAMLPDAAEATVSTKRIFKLIDGQSDIDPWDTTQPRKSFKLGETDFESLHFHYPNRPEVEVLRGLSLQIAPGQTVALVGASGNGKSTLMQLLLRFYDATQGRVLVDKTDVREYQPAGLRGDCAIVQQEPALFAGSIADNILYGKPSATMDEVRSAAEAANIHEWILTQPDQYDTDVGPRGGKLSGGQKQRVCIARAVIRDPKLLLLDEATSALDSQSEKAVQNALEKLMQGRTTLVIAHRLSTIRDADKIVVLDKGAVAEAGTHDELIKLGRVYANLYKISTESERAHHDE